MQMVNQLILVYDPQSMLDSQDAEEKRMTKRVLKHLHNLKVRICSMTHNNNTFCVHFTL